MKRERRIEVLLLKLSFRIKQLWSQGIFADLFLIQTLADLPLDAAHLELQVKLGVPLPHLFPPGINWEKEQSPLPLFHPLWLNCCNTKFHASAWGALTLLAFLNYHLFSRSLIRFCNTQFLAMLLLRSIISHISCFFHIWALMNQSFPSFLLKPFCWEYIQNVITKCRILSKV